MNPTTRRTLVVLAVVGVCALVVYATVQATAVVLPGLGASSATYADSGSTSGGTQATYTCPRTGCTASTCHATQGGQGYGGSGTGGSGGYGSGQDSGGSSQGSQDPLAGYY